MEGEDILKFLEKYVDTSDSPLVEFLLTGMSLKIINSILVMITGLVIGYLLTFIFNMVAKSAKKRMTDRKVNTFYTVLKSVTQYMIIAVVFIKVFSIFDPTAANSLLTFASFGGVAIGFGAQSIVKDILTGMFILIEDQFGVGDVITLEGHSGTVESIGIRTTKIRGADGDVHIIPNGEIKIVTNKTHDFNRAVVDLNITFDTDVDKVLEVLSDEMKIRYKDIKGIISEPKVLGIIGFSDDFIKIRIIADCNIGENWPIERELRRLIKIRLEKENIKYPFKQQIIQVTEQSKGDPENEF